MKARRNGAPFTSRMLSLVPMCLLVGFAESLGVFFWSHVRGGLDTVWLRDLAGTVIPGTFLSALLVLVLAFLLAGLKAGLAAAAGRGARAKARRILDGMDSAPVIVLVYLCLRMVISSNSILARILSGVIAGLLVIAVIAADLPRRMHRLERAAPLALAVIAPPVIWFALGAISRGRFEADETLEVLLWSGLPVLVMALAWIVSRDGGRMRAALVFSAALALCALFIVSKMPAGRKKAGGDRPNVVFITIDTLRIDRVMGEEPVMPRLAALAREGAYYTRTYTPIPKTQQSVSSFMTGLYPWHHGARFLHTPLSTENETLAERFAKAGYYTAAFVHNIWIDYGMGHEQGFYEYHDYGMIESYSYLLHSLLPLEIADHLVGRKRGASGFQVDGRVMTDKVVAWLEDDPPEPYFLWVHYFDPHWPYLPPEEAGVSAPEDYRLAYRINALGRKRTVPRGEMIYHAKEAGITKQEVEAATSLYSGECAYTDRQVGRILDLLKYDRTPLVVVSADHGESLGEHDYHFHHGSFTYDVCLRVPLLLWQPGRIPGGLVVDAPVSTMDIVPTISRLAGLAEGNTDGKALPGLGLHSTGEETRAMAFESEAAHFSTNERTPVGGIEGKWRGVVKEGMKLIAVPLKKGVRFELYDLDKDPAEERNLFHEKHPAAALLVEALRAEGHTVGGGEKTGSDFDITDELGEEEIKRLKSLGYIE